MSIPTSIPHRASAPLSLMASGHLSFGDSARLSAETTLAGAASEPDKQKPRALVVDDAPDVTEMLAMLLRFAGYDVVTVFSAIDALETARHEEFNVVVSDIGMPGMNGYELAEALRALPTYQHIPLIAVTGFAMYDDRDRALDSGFNAFLTKPINPMDLIDLIRRL
ncbi:MAG TPA: response regulator [Pyrinomonadaceae bacterium]|nr:response regulator [Pyrinomonadaceae bacterium]